MPARRSVVAVILAGATVATVAAALAGCGGGGDDDRPEPGPTTAAALHSVTGLCDAVDAAPYLALAGLGSDAQVERLSFDSGGGRAGDPWSACVVVRVARPMLLPTELTAPEAADDTEGQVLAVKLWITPDAAAAGAAYVRRLGSLPGVDPADAGSRAAPVDVAGFDTAARASAVGDLALDRVARHTLVGHTGNAVVEATFTETCAACRSLLPAAREAWRPTVPAARAFPLLETTLRGVAEKARG